jgi:hypothetical protein
MTQIISIFEPGENEIRVQVSTKTDTKKYRATRDAQGLGDWNVSAEYDGGRLSQGVWVETKNGAIQLILETIDVIEDGDYERSGDPYS